MSTAFFNKEVPFSIREKLKEIGLSTPILFEDEHNNRIVLYSQLITYACAFDFLFRKGYLISISKNYDLAEECFSGAYDWCVDGSTTKDSDAGGFADTWLEAANEAIGTLVLKFENQERIEEVLGNQSKSAKKRNTQKPQE